MPGDFILQKILDCMAWSILLIDSVCEWLQWRLNDMKNIYKMISLQATEFILYWISLDISECLWWQLNNMKNIYKTIFLQAMEFILYLIFFSFLISVPLDSATHRNDEDVTRRPWQAVDPRNTVTTLRTLHTTENTQSVTNCHHRYYHYHQCHHHHHPLTLIIIMHVSMHTTNKLTEIPTLTLEFGIMFSKRCICHVFSEHTNERKVYVFVGWKLSTNASHV